MLSLKIKRKALILGLDGINNKESLCFFVGIEDINRSKRNYDEL
jgi:hypothetical protein